MSPVKGAALPDGTAFDAASLVTSVETAAGFWQMGILWTPLIPGESTHGTYSLMEQLMPAKAGPPPHVHDQGDEVFYILDGEMALQLGDQVVIGTSGQLVRIPAGTPHAFAVRTETARVLNFYVPAALDLEIAMLGTPATSVALPPPGAQRPPTAEQEQAFAQRLHDLATQTMSAQRDLLGEYRDHAAAHPNMP
jgi:quercetin dioxygenase-like cupin family protein